MTRGAVLWIGVATLATALLQVSIGAGHQAPELIFVDVSVETARGAFVRDLSQEDFRVYSDGRLRPIAQFSVKEEPISVLLVVDLSLSASERFFDPWRLDPNDPRYSAWYDPRPLGDVLYSKFVEVLGPADRIRFGSFGADLTVTERFTSDRNELRAAANHVVQLPIAERMGPSPIWDVLAAAVTVTAQESGKRVIVLLTDGQSTGHRATAQDVAVEAALRNVSVHVVSLAFDEELPQGPKTVELFQPNLPLRQIATMTGGAFLSQGENRPYRLGRLSRYEAPPADFLRANNARWPDPGVPLARIARSLHAFYRLGFVADLDSAIHALRVEVARQGVSVRFRQQFGTPRSGR